MVGHGILPVWEQNINVLWSQVLVLQTLSTLPRPIEVRNNCMLRQYHILQYYMLGQLLAKATGWKTFLESSLEQKEKQIKDWIEFCRTLNWPWLWPGHHHFSSNICLRKRTSPNKDMGQFHVFILFVLKTLEFHWITNTGWSKMLGSMTLWRSTAQIISRWFASRKNYVILSSR